MVISRNTLIDPERSGAYHLTSRCVRRAFLCGDEAEHRRAWVEESIRSQASAFAIDILGFAVMSNHLHLVVRTQPERVREWSDRAVVERWGMLFPQIDPVTGSPGPWDPAQIERYAAEAAWVAVRRERLGSVSWFMRLLKQRIARRANREDGVTGHFWEGRFTSVPLLNDGAVLACMVYADLNPIRAAMATTPEASDYTSIELRIEARQDHRKADGFLAEIRAGGQPPAGPDLIARTRARIAAGPEAGLWLADLATATNGHLSLDDYLELVDATGRMIATGKRGRIPAHLHPILERLQIDVDTWLDTMRSPRRFLGTGVGALARLVAEAARRGINWSRDPTGIHRDRRRPAPA